MPGGGFGNVPAGATLVKIRLPYALAPISPGQGNGHSPLSSPTPLLPFASPTPLAAAPGASPGSTPSPAQAVTITVNGTNPISQTIGLSASSGACAGFSNGTMCQAVFSLPPGTYTASVSVYTSPNPAPNALLAPAQTIAFTVVSGGANTVNLVLGGVPASLNVVPGSSTSFQNAQGGIDLYGAGKHPLIAEMLDNNQNVIVGVPMPSVLVNQAGGALTMSLAQPTLSNPSTFTVVAPAAPSASTATLRVSAGASVSTNNPCVAATAVCNGTVTVDLRQLLAVANSSANTVTLYAAGQNSPINTIQNGITDPQALVFDASGDLFVASQAGSVTEYSPPYTGAPTVIAIGVSHPQALALDIHSNLFVANGSASNTVTEYAPPYTGGPTTTVSTGIDDPVSIGVDSAANLFVVNQSANTVTLYASPYNNSPITVSNGLNGPNSLALDSRGNLFVSNLNSTPNSVLEFSPPFTTTSAPVATITSGVNEQGAIGMSGLSSNLFVPNQGANSVTEYAPPYSGTPTIVTGGQNQPVALAIDASANLYVANYGNNTVTEYPPPYAGTSWMTFSNGISNPQALALSPPTTGLGAIIP